MVREIRGAKMNPKSSFKNQVAQNTRGRKLREQIQYTRGVSQVGKGILNGIKIYKNVV